MSIKQISVFLENQPGALYAMTGVLAQNKVDMRALSLAETKDFGIVRMIVDNVYAATTILKDAGYVHSVTPVVGVAIPDTPGGLNRVLQVLTDERVNVEYMYAFLGGQGRGPRLYDFPGGGPRRRHRRPHRPGHPGGGAGGDGQPVRFCPSDPTA